MVGQSATQANLTANAVQLGFGALDVVEHNQIAGNQNLIPGGADGTVGTAVLLFLADHPMVRQNNIGGNAQVAIFVFADDAAVDNNRVFNAGADSNTGPVPFDIGLGDYGSDNQITNNKVRGYDTPADADPDDGEITGTKVIPHPHNPGAACFLPDTSAQAC